jgi:hypothetical protein
MPTMKFRLTVLALLAAAVTPGVALAGMPTVRLNDLARMRLETLSFFLLVFFLCAAVVQRLWNMLGRDFPRLPRLTYVRAVGLVAVWGLLFLVVLTMISGARELLTPGAWEKVGFTYKLAAPKDDATPAGPPIEAMRRERLERLRDALWAYARAHDGKLPAGPTDPDIAAEFWQTPDPSGVAYCYAPGQTPHRGAKPLAWEPRVFGDGQFTLFTSGEIRLLTPAELERALEEGSKS